MKEDVMYLKPNIVAEPLFNQWYAWPYLVSPASAAMMIANLHVPLMESFISAPQIHLNAAKNRALLGGKFIGHPTNKVSDIKGLLTTIREEQSHMIQLAEAISHLNKMLLAEAKGHSLSNLYSNVPDALKGYVELTYDLNNQPSVRFMEGLLYKSKYYDDSRQGLNLYEITSDDRPFSLGTPRLCDEQNFILNMPYKSEAIDMLFQMRDVPQPLSEITSALNLKGEDVGRFRSFLTSIPTTDKKNTYDGTRVRIRYYGHASLLLETKQTSVFIDPIVSYAYPNELVRYTYSDLPASIDYVLLTHNHQDHVLLETLLQIRHRVKHIVIPRCGGGTLQDPSLKMMFENLGFRNVIELDELDVIPFSDGEIIGLPFLGEHSDIDIRTKLAYSVKLNDKKLLFAADSCNLAPELYSHLHEIIGDVDILFIGMECDGAPLSWLYGPLLTIPINRAMDQSRRLNGSDFEQAMKIVEQFNVQQTYIYAMGQEPWTSYIMSIEYTEDSRPIVESNKLINECVKRGIQSERLLVQKEIFL